MISFLQQPTAYKYNYETLRNKAMKMTLKGKNYKKIMTKGQNELYTWNNLTKQSEVSKNDLVSG